MGAKKSVYHFCFFFQSLSKRHDAEPLNFRQVGEGGLEVAIEKNEGIGFQTFYLHVIHCGIAPAESGGGQVKINLFTQCFGQVGEFVFFVFGSRQSGSLELCQGSLSHLVYC